MVYLVAMSTLNQKQQEAVQITEGPLLILAGAGAGKTKTLTERILYLIKKGVEPKNILAITFTNKAAKEMRDRVVKLINEDKNLNLPIRYNEMPFVSTFHSLGVQILRECGHKIGVSKNFTIFDRADSKKAVRDALKDAGYNPKEYEPGKILNIISREKGNMVTVSEYEARDEYSYIKDAVIVSWKNYEKILKENKSLDFDDLIFKTAVLLRDNPDVLKHYQNLWQYIHVDEYQDTNEVQYMITKLLAMDHHNICVVGDIDQNIYSWRGATIKNILHFEKDYPEAKEIVLEENYRSTQNILGAANDVIKKNKMRREKNLFTRNSEGEKILVYNAYDENDEGRYIVDEVSQLIESGVKANEIAILYRANFQSRVLEENFLKKQVPYQVLGTRFYDRKEVKDVLSYIQTAQNPNDRASLSRIINTPTRGIGKVTLLKILAGQTETLSGKAKENVYNFNILIKSIRQKIETDKPSEVVKYVFKKSGMEDSYKLQGDDGMEKIDNIKELVTLSTKYDDMPLGEGINKLLEESALLSDQDELQKDNGGVKLMTVHASKGLEFDYIFVTGLEEGLFPHERMNEKKDDDEEERRLFYVALTRARKRLFLTYTTIRTIFGAQQVNSPSLFINDIDEAYIKNQAGDPVSSTIKDIFIDF